MKRKLGRRLRTRKLVALILWFPLVSACAAGGGTSGKTAAVDPPPAIAEKTMLQQAGGAADLQPSSAGTVPGDSVTVYLLDGQGYLAPMTLLLANHGAGKGAQTAAETALQWLTQDAAHADQLPAGFAAVLPEGTTTRSVKLDTAHAVASVDFSDPLPGLPAAKERKMLEALVWTLTELPGIDKVRLSVAGAPIRSLPMSGLPVDEVLTRGIGINLEHTKGVQLSRSMAVTLYFAARSADGDGYFVPVTRLIGRNPDPMRAALEELIKGPVDDKGLHAVLTPGVTLDQLTRTENTANVRLHEQGWSPETAVPAEMMEALVLTVTETTGVPQVKLAINGQDTFIDSDRRSYDLPVTRPTAVNVWKR